MKHPECLLLYGNPASKKRVARLERLAVGTKTSVVRQATPTHILDIRWNVDKYTPRWVVMLRSDDSAGIVELDGAGARDSGYNTAANVLRELGITVVIQSLNLGTKLLKDPYPLDGVFPGDKEFAKLLTNPRFVRYLKARVKEEGQWDVRRERPIVLA